MKKSPLLMAIFSLFFVLFCGALFSGCAEKSQFEIDREEREEVLRRQEEQKKRQENEINDIKRQEFWNNETKRYE